MNAIKSIFPQRLVKSLLTAGMFCMGISACADDTAAPEKSFSIADIAELERFYDSYANKRIELPGSGYESGDIVQFIDTGISHNTYTMQYEQTGDGLLVTLPDTSPTDRVRLHCARTSPCPPPNSGAPPAKSSGNKKIPPPRPLPPFFITHLS